MPTPGGRAFYSACDVEAGWVSVLLMPEYRLSEPALGEIILTACIRWADDDKFIVHMPDTHVFTFAGIAPQCVAERPHAGIQTRARGCFCATGPTA